jgi:hypothetical protein
MNKYSNLIYSDLNQKIKLCMKDKISTVMREFKHKELHTNSGNIVTNPKQAIAIALNSSRRKCDPSLQKKSKREAPKKSKKEAPKKSKKEAPKKSLKKTKKEDPKKSLKKQKKKFLKKI